ncbi:hypothetical protein [Sphingobacterium sp. 2149]|uniref:hypothetical protein n=1 Tax=Sphingobacterium sp. 2149 TaxID=2817763 RepID=UPI001AEB30A4|nr:hypothetical protein [Sphingobacterium sp. 2149]MDR6736239.1 hypothetical protein [Sphingobacterium sp. 2149]
MKTDTELKNDVEWAIKWEPQLRFAEIVVTGEDGVVPSLITLTVMQKSWKLKMHQKESMVCGHWLKILKYNFQVIGQRPILKSQTRC